MRDPYLYDDVNVLMNLENIKDSFELQKLESSVTEITMTTLYEDCFFETFDSTTLQEIHFHIFGMIYKWAGQFRTIQIVKSEDVLGGDSVRYAYPVEINKKLKDAMKELAKLKRNGSNDREVVFRLIRIVASIWQIHPFREGNTRTTIAFAVLFARHLGFDVNYDLFKEHSSYVRNALVWASQGIYSKYEYLERIFFDAILHEELDIIVLENKTKKYESIEGYKVKNYKVRPHEYVEE